MKIINLTGVFYKKNEIESDLFDYYYHYLSSFEIRLIEISNSKYEYFLGITSDTAVYQIDFLNIKNILQELPDKTDISKIKDYIIRSDFPDGKIVCIELQISEQQ